jgi:hypothetical protein
MDAIYSELLKRSLNEPYSYINKLIIISQLEPW